MSIDCRLVRHQPTRMAPLAIALGLTLVACRSLHPVRPDELGSLKPHDRVWVTEAGSKAIVTSPQLVGDTLIGLVNGVPKRFPLSSTLQIDTRQVDGARTAVLASALGFGIYELIALETKPPAAPGLTTSRSCNCDVNPVCGC